MRSIFPEADAFGDFGGTPPAAPVTRNGAQIGYVFFTNDVLRIPAYSGRPINTLIGISMDGRIAGLAIVQHEEPILAVGITEERLARYVAQYQGKSAHDKVVIGAPRPGHLAIDGISGATITVMVENATVMRAAGEFAMSRGIGPVGEGGEAPDGVAASTRPPVVTIAAPSESPTMRTATRLDAAPSAAALTGAALGGRWNSPGEEPVWVAIWHQRVFEIGVLLVGLVALTFILMFQDWLARHPNALIRVRTGFNVYALFFLGWWGLAQLSVINVLTFVNAAMHGFRWETFLIDPMLFILWSFVAVTLLLWGRGVYCGWLCPFGALQELMLIVSRRLKLPQWEFSDAVHERLIAVKYVILIMLFGVSMQSLAEAALYAEVEPFKTVISMRFDREWPFVTYALALIVLSLFNRKFFCKYLCPLGAALAIPGRFRLFDWWLRRRKECGTPCQVCASRCPVRAIRPTGEINANECHYCMDCQVIYYNDKMCVPLIDRRKRRETRVKQASADDSAEVASVAPTRQ
ncbi:MAG: 4Fe-4S binding protein [Rhodocyclales bacterium]|nr:4Fe-4S binding protein [Rhodocyclales bacterium]